jgi:hypothetical protein
VASDEPSDGTDSENTPALGAPAFNGSGLLSGVAPTVPGCGLLDSLGSSISNIPGAIGAIGSAGSGVGGAVNDKDVIPDSVGKILAGSPRQIRLRTTGYSFQDNTPPNSNTISCPILHRAASGVGTYDDPITVAVPGHVGHGAEIPCGTRIYYPDFRFYGIVEDTGASTFSTPHTDIWVDGRGYSKSESDTCMNPVTKPSVTAILNPPPNLPMRAAGPITQGHSCDVGNGSNSRGGT